MIVTIDGTLAGIKENYPKSGQDFQPNLTLGVVQVTPEGEVETVKIKDDDMSHKYESGTPFSCRALVRHWQNGNRNGVSVKLLSVNGKASK